MKGAGVVYPRSGGAPVAGKVELSPLGWVHIHEPTRQTQRGDEAVGHSPVDGVLCVSLPMTMVYRIDWTELAMYL